MRYARLIVGIFLLAFLPHVASGQSPKSVTVETRIVPPFVMQEDGELTGFSIDLWREIAVGMGVESRFVVAPDVGGLLGALRTKRADVGVAAISITADRDREFDFSQPIFESGLQILVRDPSNGSRAGSPLPRIGEILFSPTLLQLLGYIVVLILIPAHLVWLVERRRKDGFLENSGYFPGILKACYWAAATLATQADEMPKSCLGRIIGVVSMFTGVIFVAYFTAQVTTSLTVEQLQGSISGPADLPGKRVATTAGSTSERYLREQKGRVVTVDRIDSAFDALVRGDVDAVVFDAPVLLYYAAHDGKGKVQVVGPVFRKENYGIIVPPGSPYRKRINNVLLRLRENGRYDAIYERWFAASGSETNERSAGR